MKQKERSERASIEAKEEMKEMQRQCQDLITKARTEKDAKTEECEELRSQVRVEFINKCSCYVTYSIGMNVVAPSKLHKHRGRCYTAEWPYCPFAVLWLC